MLTPYTLSQLADIAAIADLLEEMRQQNPDALLPDSAERLYLAESAGLEWDFDEGHLQYGDSGIAYRCTAQALALMEREPVFLRRVPPQLRRGGQS